MLVALSLSEQTYHLTITSASANGIPPSFSTIIIGSPGQLICLRDLFISVSFISVLLPLYSSPTQVNPYILSLSFVVIGSVS